MKTSEMIAYLEEHPKAKFRNAPNEHESVFEISVSNFGYMLLNRLKGIGSSDIGGNFSLKADWQLVREPVPVWEAIKALTEGKTVECEPKTENYHTCRYQGKPCVFNKKDSGMAESPTIYCLCCGTWYIKEGEED